jgi:hypothetical protein
VLVTAAAVALVTAAAVAVAATAAAPAAAAAAAAAAANPKVGVASSLYLDSAPQKLATIGARWAYDWTAQIHPSNIGIEWVPMIWSAAYLTPQNIAALQQAKADGSAHYLLGFNEPDHRSQADITPARAAALWPRLMQTGLKLGSPAPETPFNGWLRNFMWLVHAQHLTVNFIALHCYVDFTDPLSIAKLRSELITVHDTYHRPIWITELGAINIRLWGQPMEHDPTTVRAQIFMRHVFAMLNSLSFVQRYAWFTDRCPDHAASCRYSSLYTARGTLTPEGREFRRDA